MSLGLTTLTLRHAFDQTIAGAMSRELHKTAQPLTILQGLIEIHAGTRFGRR